MTQHNLPALRFTLAGLRLAEATLAGLPPDATADDRAAAVAARDKVVDQLRPLVAPPETEGAKAEAAAARLRAAAAALPDLSGRPDDEAERAALALADALATPLPDLEPAADWPDDLPERRRWLIPDWLPEDRLALLTGPGAAGKSRLTLQLAAALAAGAADWLPGPGAPALAGDPAEAPDPAADFGELTPRPVVVASWEDDRDEIHRRLPRRLRPGLADRLTFLDCARHGPAWAPAPGGSRHTSTMAELTPTGAAIRAAAEDAGAALLILDPLAAVFAANENDRALVRDFAADWDGWGRAARCAVLLVAHPPKPAGGKAADAANYSGSTDWRNAARSMWTLTPATAERPAKTPNGKPTPARPAALSLDKASYAKTKRDRLTLSDAWPDGWRAGAPAPDAGAPDDGAGF